ncbi:MAG: hypothetical protein ACE366_02720 [Bradymonadia bacterium]
MRIRTSEVFGLAALALMVSSACGPLPEQTHEAALYRDLDKVIRTRTRTQWLSDEYELQASEPYALRSVCRADVATREGVHRWINARIELQGGPAKLQYQKNGGDLDAVEDTLHLERVDALLTRAEGSMETQCPFWVKPTASFNGIEAPGGGRFAMLLETQGGLTFTRTTDDIVTVGGGGGFRMLPGYALDEGWLLAAGLEFGGGTLLPRDEDGEGRRLRARWEFGIPVVMRYQQGVIFWDLEAALINRAPENKPEDFRMGLRTATSFGFSGLRIGELMPYAGFWVGYEYLEADPAEQLSPSAFRLGTKVGVDWGP